MNLPKASPKAAMLLLIALAFVLRAAFFLGPTYYVEEAMAANMALAVRGGAIPYADFFYGHPPSVIYSSALFQSVLPVNPLLAAKLGSLLLSALLVLFAWRLGGLPAAALLSSSFGFFYWFAFVLPLAPLACFLLAAHYFLEKRRIPLLAGIFFFAALMSEFSAALYLLASLVFFRRNSRILLTAALAFAAAVAAISMATGGAFLSQAVLSQTAARAASYSAASNASTLLSFFLVYAAPLLLLAALSRGPLLWLVLSCAAAFLVLFPGLTNNTAQFLLPFVAVAAVAPAGARMRKMLPAFCLVFFAATLVLLGKAGLFAPQAPHLAEISALISANAPAGATLWGTPEANLYSLYSGVPITGGQLDLTPTTLAMTGTPLSTSGLATSGGPPPSQRRPDILVISDYFRGWKVYGANATAPAYEQIGLFSEPVVGLVTVYRQKV